MRLLITGAWSEEKRCFSDLEANGHEIQFMQQERDELPCDPAWVEGVVCNGLFLYHPIELFPNLRFIQLTSAGYDRVDMEYVKAHDIEIHNARGVYSIPMAEFALAGVLQLYKQSRFFYENQKAHRWEKRRDLMELSGKTVLIVGCGDVGTECAKRFRAFGCKVIGVNRTVKPKEYFDEVYALGELDTLLLTADIVVVTVALTDETRDLMNTERIRSMKPDAILVNISRGAVAPIHALEETLGHIGGAVLDVFDEEPLLPDRSLWNMENVLITPHNSFVGEGNGARLNALICNNIHNTI